MNKKLIATIAGVVLAAGATLVGVKTAKNKKSEEIAEEISEVEEVTEEA